ncbi:MAG: nucleotidyltransferase family protein [Christensenellales bacterium]
MRWLRRAAGHQQGIERRLRRFADTARTRDSLLQAVKTRRYPYARLSRLATHALLGVTQAVVDSNPLPPAAFLLGFRRGCEPLLSHLAQG